MSEIRNNESVCSAGELPPCQVVLDMLPAGVVMVDSNGSLRTWNRAMEQLTGYAAEEVLGGPCSVTGCDSCEVTDSSEEFPQCSLLAEAQNINHGGKTFEERECTIRAKNGEHIPVLKNACALADENGDFCGMIETLTDLRSIKKLEQNLTALQQSTMRSREVGRLVGTSEVMQSVYERVQLAAQSFATVLIRGETGTGKELVGEAIHESGPRYNAPFVKVNCSALPENLLESELFGHIRGAFTGAVENKMGDNRALPHYSEGEAYVKKPSRVR